MIGIGSNASDLELEMVHKICREFQSGCRMFDSGNVEGHWNESKVINSKSIRQSENRGEKPVHLRTF
jgi:hypothetical protein